MQKIVVIFSIILFSGFWLKAAPASLDEANKLYAEKDYEAAAGKYEEILAEEGPAPELYYNLGNAYFKNNETGLAILNYERALRLDPVYADAAYNLEFANQKVIDNVEMSDAFFLRKWMDALIKMLGSNGWFYLASLAFFLMLTGILTFIFAKTKLMRKTGFYVGIILLVISLAGVTFSGIRKKQLENHPEAIIMTGAVVVKGSPDRSGTDLFQLHEGTKVTVLSELGDWFEIRIGNGNVGWIEIKFVERI